MARVHSGTKTNDMGWRVAEIRKGAKRLKKRMKQRAMVRELALTLLRRTPLVSMSLH